MGLCESGARSDAESRVSESPGDLHCASPDLHGFIQLPAMIVHGRPRYAELTAPTIIPQPLSETFRLVEVRQRLRKVRPYGATRSFAPEEASQPKPGRPRLDGMCHGSERPDASSRAARTTAC